MAARLTAYVVVGIVAATLIAGLIVGAQRDDSDGPVDVIVHNARVYTADADGSMAEAVAIRGNQILRVGSNREINRLRRPQTIVIDAEGAAVLPGFNDSHVHFIEGGLRLRGVDLAGVATLEQLEERLRAWADANPGDGWILAHGWRPGALGEGVTTRQQLDAIIADRPVALFGGDDEAEIAWVNSRALARARITARTPNPAGGVVIKDSRTGQPTGVLKGPAAALAARAVPPATRDERAHALRLAIAEANRRGITSVQNAATDPADLELFEAARRSGDLSVRIYAALSLPAGPLTPETLAALEALAEKYPDDPLMKTGAVKIRVTEEESETPDSGEPAAHPALSADQLNRIVGTLDANGWQVMAHAAGEAAFRRILDAYEGAARSNRTPSQARRHRIEHADPAGVTDAARLGRSGVVASAQPQDEADYRGLAAAGARLAFGSDWPASTLDPIAGLNAAVNGVASESGADAPVEDATPKKERLALKAAIDAYTSGAAYASFDEQRKGSVTAGMLADLVVLSDDIFAGPPAALGSTTVAMTIFDGKIVYRRGERFTN